MNRLLPSLTQKTLQKLQKNSVKRVNSWLQEGGAHFQICCNLTCSSCYWCLWKNKNENKNRIDGLQYWVADCVLYSTLCICHLNVQHFQGNHTVLLEWHQLFSFCNFQTSRFCLPWFQILSLLFISEYSGERSLLVHIPVSTLCIRINK